MGIDIKNCKFKNGGKLLTIPHEASVQDVSVNGIEYVKDRCKKWFMGWYV